MANRFKEQRLNGLFPLSYMGVIPVSPTNFVIDNRPPTATDSKNFYIGDMWLDNSTDNPPKAKDIWMLVSLSQGVATWINFASGDIVTLEGNTGGKVSPDATGNINVIGDGTTCTVAGNPAINTLTISVVGGTGVVETLTGNTGGAVGPTAGNINVVGDGTTITITGNPGTSTLTASVIGGEAANSFPTDSGTAVPSAGVLNIKANVSTQHCGSSVEFTGSSNTVLFNVTDSNNNTIIGKSSGNATLTSTNCTILGNDCGAGLTSGSSNIFIGNQAGTATTAITTGNGNTIIGDASAIAGLVAPSATVNSFYALGASIGTAGTPTTPFLHNYGGNLAGNTFLGYNSGSFNAGQVGSDLNNTGLGQQALHALTTGNNNTGSGYQAGFNITTGSHNTFTGHGSGENITTGTFNTIIGDQAGANYASSESNNIILGSHSGVISENQVIRIGNDGVAAGSSATLKAFVLGIRGITTGNADAVAVLVDSANQLGTVSSSLRYKDNVNDLGSISSSIYAMRPVVFNYKNHSPESKSIGLIAEEVNEVMPHLVVKDKEGIPETIKYHELPILLLNELQKLQKRITELENKRCGCN